VCRGSRPGRVDGRRWRSYPLPGGSRRRGLLLVRCFRAFQSRAWFLFGVLLYDVLTRYRNAVPTAFRASLHRTGSL
jgi:hypothetical protein